MDIDTAALTVIDWVVLGVVVVSALYSLLRGFTREAMSLASWVLALFGGRLLAPSLAALLGDTIANPELRELVAFGCLFVIILALGSLLAHVFAEAVRDSPLSLTDRVLGTAFGFVRGVLAVVVAIAFAREYVSAEGWWQQSVLIPHLALLEGWTHETAYSVAGWLSR